MKILIALILLAGSCLAQQSRHDGRYCLIAVKAPDHSTTGSIAAFEEVLLLDSDTGRVWKYEPSSTAVSGDTKITVNPYFDEITVEGIHGSHIEELKQALQMAKFIEQEKKSGKQSPVSEQK